VIDDQELDRTLRRFELQAEFLDRGKDRRARCVVRRSGAAAGRRESGCGLVEPKFQMEIEDSRNPGFVEYRPQSLSAAALLLG
jgi:hypothetical protein